MGISQLSGGKQGVVAGEIRLIEGERIEIGTTETQRRGHRGELTSVTQDVFDVFGTDMSGAHHHVDGGAEVLADEDFGEEDQAGQLFANRAGAGSDDLQVVTSHLAELAEPRGQSITSGSRLHGLGGASVSWIFDVLLGAPAALVTRDFLLADEDADVRIVATDEDMLTQ